eukprot:gene10115-biopygen2878
MIVFLGNLRPNPNQGKVVTSTTRAGRVEWWRNAAKGGGKPPPLQDGVVCHTWVDPCTFPSCCVPPPITTTAPTPPPPHLNLCISFPGTKLELVQDNAIQISPSLVLVPAYPSPRLVPSIQGSFQLSRITDKLVPAILAAAGDSFQLVPVLPAFLFLVPARSTVLCLPEAFYSHLGHKCVWKCE